MVSQNVLIALNVAAAAGWLYWAWERRRRSRAGLRRAARTTVVIGAGVIGLCTAYHLARRNRGSRRIVVVDAQNSAMQATSASNTGCLLVSSLTPDMRELGDFCMEAWHRQASDVSFCKATGYRKGATFNVSTGSSGKQSQLNPLPSWVRWDPRWKTQSVSGHGRDAIITAPALGKWLHHECLLLGVEFLFDAEALSAALSSTGTIKSITYRKMKQKKSVLDCDQLLIAAGPWSDTLVTALFQSSTANLDFITDAGDWLILKSTSKFQQRDLVSLFFDDIVSQKLEYSGRNNNTLWTTGERTAEARLPHVTEDAKPHPDAIHKLRHFARRFVDADGTSATEGRAFRPSTASGRPIMTEVHSSKLTVLDEDAGETSKSGIFICTGHGSSGMTLAMGSGMLMSQLMDGETPAISLSKFGLPSV